MVSTTSASPSASAHQRHVHPPVRSPPMIDSTNVDGRRLLRCDTIDDMFADARVCVGPRRLRQVGNRGRE